MLQMDQGLQLTNALHFHEDEIKRPFPVLLCVPAGFSLFQVAACTTYPCKDPPV